MGIGYLALDSGDRVMIIPRQILRLHVISLFCRFVFLLVSTTGKSP
jgi:hypothetical protein